jgi:hypothetical protein
LAVWTAGAGHLDRPHIGRLDCRCRPFGSLPRWPIGLPMLTVWITHTLVVLVADAGRFERPPARDRQFVYKVAEIGPEPAVKMKRLHSAEAFSIPRHVEVTFVT